MNPELYKLFFNHNLIDILISIFLIFASIYITINSINVLKLNRAYTLIIYSIHNLMFPLHMLFLYKYGTDSVTYFINPQGYNYVDMQSGQIFMNKILIFFELIKFNFYNLNYFFSLLSLFSIYLYLKVIQGYKIINSFNYLIVFIFLCLPSIHFWHMGFSKDTLTFFSISLIIYEISKSKKNLTILAFSILLLYFVRPHISLMVIVSLFIYYFVNFKGIFFKIIISFVVLMLSIVTLRAIFNFTDLQSLITFLNIFQDQYIQKEATALTSDRNFLLRLLSYLFLPNIILIKDTSIFYLYIALENTFLIFLFIKIFTLNFFSLEKFKTLSFLLFFSVISLCILT